MLPEQSPERRSVFRNPVLYTSGLLVVALVYVGGVFFSRWQENHEIERRAAQKQRERDKRAVDFMGGSRLEIQSFYASPGVIHRGETLQLCYDVANAKVVRLEPQDNPVWPSYARCVDVTPAKDTTYTLTAEDGRGNSKTATVTVQVR